MKKVKGNRVAFECNSAGDSKWYHGYPGIGIISDHKNLHFDNVQLQDAGNYYCYGLQTQQFEYFLSEVTLKVVGK